MKLTNRLLSVLIVLCLMTILAVIVLAKTESINVEPGKDIIRAVDLASGDRITMTFTVSGPAPSTVNFFMVLPNGTTVDNGPTSQYKSQFFTNVKGTLHLHFDNTDSSNGQLLTLNYEVEHYIFGIPQMIFLLGGIAVVLLCVAAGYMIMGKYS